MSELLDEIKDLAYSIAEKYLRKQESMNDNILNIQEKNKFNDQILKRICEQSNQQVYLSLFNNPSINKGDITFDMADYNKIKKVLDKRGEDMNDYKMSPKDYKGTIKVTKITIDSDKDKIDIDKDVKRLNGKNNKIDLKNKLFKLLSGTETLKTAELREAEDNINTMYKHAKNIIANGESFGDMSKLAMRYSKKNEYNVEKTASLYKILGDELKKEGYNLKYGLTKVSSMPLDAKSEYLKPVEDYNKNLIKIAALNEFNSNLRKYIQSLTNTIERI